ncbi:hypothetical protein [Pseudohongiella sp. O18]|uniref:hypothetical protein n=1 Tax=Pseudohongiella sp. O18 TaxID=2904248 RepID=UPI001F385A06|nr:hypothetical protein [Pseudohongiella sp. O18]
MRLLRHTMIQAISSQHRLLSVSRATPLAASVGRALAVLLVSFLVLQTLPAIAQSQSGDSEPGSAGSMDVFEAEATPEVDPERLQWERDAAGLMAQLDNLTNSLGLYDPALLEVQRDLGSALLRLDRHQEAADVYARALQLARVTDGLYSAQQLAVLDGLIAAHSGLQDWEKVDDYEHLRFSLATHQQDPQSPEYIDALLARSEWHLQASRHNLLSRPGNDFQIRQLHDLNLAHEQALATASEQSDPALHWELLDTMLQTDIEIARHVAYQGMRDIFPSEPRYVMQTVCRMVSDGNGGAQRVCWQQRVSNPDFYNSAANQRRHELERTRANLLTTRREMEQFMVTHPDFVSQRSDEVNNRLAQIDQVVSELQREASRAAFRSW